MPASSNLPCATTRIGAMSSAETFPDETPTLSLCGQDFFFTGHVTSYGRVPHVYLDHDIVRFDHMNENNLTEYLVLGPKGHYFRLTRSREGDEAANTDTSNLEDYCGIVEFLDEHDVERPAFLYLGPDNTYYVRTDDGSEKWVLSEDIVRDALQVTPTANQSGAQSLWLGTGGSWVVQYRNGSFNFDLKGRYVALERTLELARDDELRISALALDLLGDKSFAIVYDNGVVEHETGSLRDFDPTGFEVWVEEQWDL
ncbi:hypothetical protein FZEAL_9437 [Fusarium zealandicum]|uniref:Uncharacterized protein n=1 Tax=Fusarium zealandicum TaxID=1053134 RepID=A0A8H4UAT0_9HYPO|nr:hypothetical protein FZEAL_9437 [Fusarium zealandicum]